MLSGVNHATETISQSLVGKVKNPVPLSLTFSLIHTITVVNTDRNEAETILATDWNYQELIIVAVVVVVLREVEVRDIKREEDHHESITVETGQNTCI